MLAIPVITLGNYFRELAFHARWSRVVWPVTLPENGCTEAAES
jgi:hypothetical protein